LIETMLGASPCRRVAPEHAAIKGADVEIDPAQRSGQSTEGEAGDQKGRPSPAE